MDSIEPLSPLTEPKKKKEKIKSGRKKKRIVKPMDPLSVTDEKKFMEEEADDDDEIEETLKGYDLELQRVMTALTPFLIGMIHVDPRSPLPQDTQAINEIGIWIGPESSTPFCRECKTVCSSTY